jgi:hypothetical protein
MEPADPQQVFVRNEQGKVWGPISLPSVELLFENGALAGRVHVSEDGVHFVEPGALPGVRDAFPRAVWGAAAAGPVPPQAPGAPIAGPGAMAAAAARAAKTTAPSRAPPTLQQAPAAPPAPAAAPPAPAPAASAPPAPVPSVPTQAATTEERGPPPAKGDLGQLGPIHLYYLAASAEQTGLLTFKLSDRTIDVHFKKGKNL